MSKSKSPAGDVHPGKVVTDDQVKGTKKEQDASELPSTLVWVDVDGSYVPVVRIEVTGTEQARRITKFGPDGQMLDTTTMRPPPPMPR